MPVLPEEVAAKKFGRRARGYDRSQVELFPIQRSRRSVTSLTPGVARAAVSAWSTRAGRLLRAG